MNLETLNERVSKLYWVFRSQILHSLNLPWFPLIWQYSSHATTYQKTENNGVWL